jgi:hypothetical protein
MMALYWNRLKVIFGQSIITAVCLLSGCEMFQQPKILVEYPDGRIIQVQGVGGQSHPATLIDENLNLSTGGVDQALSSLSSSANWLAIGLILVGLASIILSKWIPMMPRSMSVICMASGGVIWAFPLLLDRYSGMVFIAIAIIGGLWLFGLWDNKRKLNVEPKS